MDFFSYLKGYNGDIAWISPHLWMALYVNTILQVQQDSKKAKETQPLQHWASY